MTSSATPRAGVVRLVVLALFVATLGVASGVGSAGAGNPFFVTKWGTRGSGDNQFEDPVGVGVDGDGNVYVLDAGNERVQKFTANGTFVSKWDWDSGGSSYPHGIAVTTSGNVYVNDSNNNTVREFTADGTPVTQWGSPGSGNGQFAYPQALAADATYVYVADYENHRVQKFTSDGTYVTQWGANGEGNGQFVYPRGIAVDSEGNVYVTDVTHRVQRFTSTGTFLAAWDVGGVPDGVAVDGDGNVYLTDFNRVRMYDPTGALLTTWGSEQAGSADGQFHIPWGLAVDADHNVYVADEYNYRVQKFAFDTVDPSVDLVTPPGGAIYRRNQAVASEYSCTDEVGGSGVGSCIGSVPDGDPIDTSVSGDHDFTVMATDLVGNSTQVTHTYTVADPLPDGRIKKGATGTYFGDDIYNTTGAGQTRTGAATRGSTITYFVAVQNDAPFSEPLRLRGTASTTAFRVLYSTAGVDITPRVTAGTYTTPALAPGAGLVIKVEVKVKTTAPTGSSLTATLTAKSAIDPSIKDTVKFVTRRA